MQLKPSKCIFFARKIEIQGHRVTQEGRKPISRRVEAILSMPTPTNISAVKCFGYFGLYSMFVYPNTSLAILAQEGCMSSIDRRNSQRVSGLKQAITGPDVMLYHPDWNAPFELHVDASKLECWLKRRMVFFALSDLHCIPSIYTS